MGCRCVCCLPSPLRNGPSLRACAWGARWPWVRSSTHRRAQLNSTVHNISFLFGDVVYSYKYTDFRSQISARAAAVGALAAAERS